MDKECTLLEQIKADREAGTPQEWSAERTACRDLPDTVWAIVWDKTPGGRKNADGTTNYSLRIPVLLGTDWMASPEDGVTQIADMLNFAERAEAALLAAEEVARLIEECGSCIEIDDAVIAYRNATG